MSEKYQWTSPSVTNFEDISPFLTDEYAQAIAVAGVAAALSQVVVAMVTLSRGYIGRKNTAYKNDT